MSASGGRVSKLIRVGGPLIRVKMRMQPAEPPRGPVTPGPLIRVGGPLIRVKMRMQPAEPPVHLELTLTLRPDTDAAAVDAVFAKLSALVEALNAYEADLGGAGFWVDAEKSGPRPGPSVRLVLVPNDPTGSESRLRSVADLLANAAGRSGVAVVKVVSPADPEKPLYQTAA